MTNNQLLINGISFQGRKEIISWSIASVGGGLKVDWGNDDVEIIAGEALYQIQKVTGADYVGLYQVGALYASGSTLIIPHFPSSWNWVYPNNSTPKFKITIEFIGFWRVRFFCFGWSVADASRIKKASWVQVSGANYPTHNDGGQNPCKFLSATTQNFGGVFVSPPICPPPTPSSAAGDYYPDEQRWIAKRGGAFTYTKVISNTGAFSERAGNKNPIVTVLTGTYQLNIQYVDGSSSSLSSNDSLLVSRINGDICTSLCNFSSKILSKLR